MNLRISWSVLQLVERGLIDEAIAVWRGKGLPATPQMELGKKWHRAWELETNKTGCLPREFGGKKLGAFQTERKIEKKFALGEHEIMLVGVVDLYEPDTKIARDYKTGKTSVGKYVNSHQHSIYALLLPFERFVYHRYNPYSHEVESAIVHITEKERERGRDYIETYTSEFINQLEFIGVI